MNVSSHLGSPPGYKKKKKKKKKLTSFLPSKRFQEENRSNRTTTKTTTTNSLSGKKGIKPQAVKTFNQSAVWTPHHTDRKTKQKKTTTKKTQRLQSPARGLTARRSTGRPRSSPVSANNEEPFPPVSVWALSCTGNHYNPHKPRGDRRRLPCIERPAKCHWADRAVSCPEAHWLNR